MAWLRAASSVAMAKAGGTLPPPSQVTTTISAMAPPSVVGWMNGPARRHVWPRLGGGVARGEDGAHERLHALPVLADREAAVAAQQLPRVDVRRDDEQVDELRRGGPGVG